MKGFEMFARDDKSLDMLSLMCENTNKGNNNVLMSRTLKVITKCDVNSVPVYLLTSNHYYMTVTDSHDEVHDHFLSPEGEFFDNCGIIAKMDFIPLQGDASCKTRESKLTFEFWKQYITNSQSYGESLDQLDVFENEQEHLTFAKYNANQPGPDNQEQNTQSLFFLIMNDEDGGLKSAHPYDNGHYTKLCILLDPSAAEGGGQLKSYNKIQDTLQLNFQNEGKQFKDENEKYRQGCFFCLNRHRLVQHHKPYYVHVWWPGAQLKRTLFRVEVLLVEARNFMTPWFDYFRLKLYLDR